MATGPILRGTTPPIKIRLKRTDLEVNTIEILELRIWQEDHELVKHLSDVTIDTDDMDFLEAELASIFAIETDKQTYVFSGYEVNECYKEDNGLVKVVCIK